MNLRRIASWGGGYPLSVAAVLAAAVLLVPLRSVVPLSTVMLLLVPVIIVVARLAGPTQSATSAVVAFLALDFLFIPPYYHLTVASVNEWIGLFVFLIVALVSGQQTGRLKEREQVALQRQRELELLNDLSFRIAAEKSVFATAEFIVAELTGALGAERAALYIGSPPPSPPACLAQSGDFRTSSGESALVSWSLRHASGIHATGAGVEAADAPPGTVAADGAIPGVTADGDYLLLQTADSVEGVLYVRVGKGAVRPDPRLLAAIANLAAASLERQRLEAEAARAIALDEADRMKTVLVSSLSHELKTPLAAATARVTGLIEEGDTPESGRLRQELVAVSEDLGRLNASIGDLLDLSRLESDSWQPNLEPQEVADVLGTVASRLPAHQRERVSFDLPSDLPLVHCDFAQLARALANLVENALAYAPAGSPVLVRASASRGRLVVSVEDRGPGVPDAERDEIFSKFYRGSASNVAPAGTGLGLAITREIVSSHRGSVHVEDGVPHGARFVVSLPVGPYASKESDGRT